MKNILQAIQSRLTEVSELNYIDEDWGQLDYYSQNMPVQWPCCLIDINNLDYSNTGVDRFQTPRIRQMAKASVKITLANLKLTNTSFHAPQQQKNDAWLIWELTQKIHEKLHGWNPDENCSYLIRKNLQRNLREDGVQEYQIQYEFELKNI
ncbi:hypothetical protein [Flavobacterium columnare]|uniref:hypothetical protein n=1 Tax=Flavobacterium columnare TaxID=996 RepID=UPI0013D4BB15|nr:hypothetical protein [Flavobacterium columnare]